MSIIETAERLVGELELLPDIASSRIQAPGEVEVAANSGASIVLSRRADGAAGLELWDDVSRLIVDGPTRLRGYAYTDDGRCFNLNDPDGFAAFFKEEGRRLSHEELARLLARYEGRNQGVELPQNTVVHVGDFQGALEPEVAASIPGFTELRHESSGDQEKLAFCTFFISRESPDRVFRIGLNRWEATWDKDGHFELRVVPLARGLDSPRYRRR
jgi:hypothetical protein